VAGDLVEGTGLLHVGATHLDQLRVRDVVFVAAEAADVEAMRPAQHVEFNPPRVDLGLSAGAFGFDVAFAAERLHFK